MKGAIRMLTPIICVLTILALGGITGYILEKKAFNNGICPKCGNHMRMFDEDSQGGRGYECNECDYGCWVSYDSIDKRRVVKYR